MRAISILALIICKVRSQEIHASGAKISCTRNGGEISCEFTLPEGTETVDLLGCLNDEACIQAHIAIVQSKEELLAAVDQEKNSAASIEATEHGAESYPITVAGQTYQAPWSQYGSSVASALRERPSDLNSWEYGDWMVNFAVAIRGNPTEENWNPSSVDEAVSILKSSIELYDSLEQQGLVNSKFYIANGYLTLGETMVLDFQNPHYETALEYFEISSKLFKYSMNQNELPPGIERDDIELKWADTLVLTGVLSVEKQMKHVGEGILEGQLNVASKAADMLEMASAVFRRLLQVSFTNRIKLANALQNYAAMSIMTSLDLQKSSDLLEEAIEHYLYVFEEIEGSNPERNGIISGIAQAYSSLSDNYLQAGKYDMAKDKYRQTMMWYKNYNLDPPTDEVQVVDIEGTLLEETEKALEDYNSMLYGGQEISIPNNYAKPGDQIYESDFLYEAGLHANLGSLRMARNELHLAINHFANAIELYTRSTVDSGQSIGDVKLSLAMAYFKQGEYGFSLDAYSDAVDVYSVTVKAGNNPMTEELENLLQDMEGLENFLQEQGLDAETIQLLTDVNGDEENLREALNNDLFGNNEDILFDLDALKASLENATLKDEL
eukprot:CAMPEP_0194216994 /NCGR_PEP_ID=MMETSP0156-20130528/20134_1 /TAXON_ID=33649 /ORGANISM="Thalassionema nitzschioides, Strain L26-B" /LENGTH=609 /DNA_ID=CAMNT_0038945903 /DNA_START=6 /DNA_END=1835 /DNA_ORIENTATION=-